MTELTRYRRRVLTVLATLAILVAPGSLTFAAEPDAAKDHPLDPAIRWARQTLKRLEGVKDYSATLIKRERVDGKLLDKQFIFAKVRHEPFSVYLYFLGPESLKGRECIYVKGQNNDNLLAHEGSGLIGALGTHELDPQGKLAMSGQRYPITSVGIKNLLLQLIERGEQDKKIGAPVEVKFRKGSKIADRPVIEIEVRHPRRHEKHLYYLAKIYVDAELNLPIRYVAYDWPAEEGGEPPLIEEYTYYKLQLNRGYTDEDFDRKNANYKF